MKPSEIVFPAVFLLLANPFPAVADVANLFAECLGRYEAEVVFAQSYNRGEVAEITHLRDQFAELLAAATPNGKEAAVLSVARDFQSAHTQLIDVAELSFDTAQADQARARLEEHMAQCQALVLSD